MSKSSFSLVLALTAVLAGCGGGGGGNAVVPHSPAAATPANVGPGANAVISQSGTTITVTGVISSFFSGGFSTQVGAPWGYVHIYTPSSARITGTLSMGENVVVVGSGSTATSITAASVGPAPKATPTPSATPTPTAAPTATPTPMPSPTPVATFNPSNYPIMTDNNPSTAGIFLGADCAALAVVSCADFATQLRHTIAMGTMYATWDQDLATYMATTGMNQWDSQNMIPDITWQAQSNNATVTLADIHAGNYDTYITQSALELKQFGQPVFLRLFHEFNMPNYAWALAKNGSDAQADADFIGAWQRVVQIFRNVGASNVKFIWCFNSSTNPNATWNLPAAAYPGDAFVDWVAFDAFNMGTQSNGRPWNSFQTLLNGGYHTAVTIAPQKPVMITEVASSEWGDGGAMKASWVDQMFSLLATSTKYPNLHALSWYETRTPYAFDSESTSPVYQSFVLDTRTVGQYGLPVRGNGAALWSITGP